MPLKVGEELMNALVFQDDRWPLARYFRQYLNPRNKIFCAQSLADHIVEFGSVVLTSPDTNAYLVVSTASGGNVCVSRPGAQEVLLFHTSKIWPEGRDIYTHKADLPWNVS